MQVLKDLGVYDAKVVAGLIADELIEAGAAIRGQIVLTLKGRLLADSVVRSLIA